MANVFVTNHGDTVLKDGWDGVVYEFNKGATVEIPDFVATHIFGYGVDDKEPCLIRLGWIKTSNDFKDGLEKLSKFEITTHPVKNHSLSPVVGKVPLPLQRGEGKTLAFLA